MRQTYSAWRAALKPDKHQTGEAFSREGFKAPHKQRQYNLQDAFTRDGKDGKGTMIQTEKFCRIPVNPILPMFAGMH